VPVYQYACTDCGQDLEVRQSFTDDSLTVCPSCEGRLRKVLSAVGVVFKGSGFYRNDSRNGTPSSDSASGEGGDGKSSTENSESAKAGASEKSGTSETSGTSEKSGASEQPAAKSSPDKQSSSDANSNRSNASKSATKTSA
jgi:putative FmdB family regulatory protein